MKTIMLMYEGPEGVAKQTSEEAPAYFGAWGDYIEAMREAGVLLGGEELVPDVGIVTLRRIGSERRVQDGPFLEAKEGLAGYFVLEVDSPEAALEWAARAPLSDGDAIELRPILERDPETYGSPG